MSKILIADDEATIRKSLGEILKSKGFLALPASNGREAIEVFRSGKPDAVLLDLKMPAMDGITAMKELKAIDPDVPVIIITAYGDVPTAVEAIKLGAYDFIIKPPDFDILILTIKRAVERRELEKTVKRLNKEVEKSLECLVGKSEGMEKILSQLHQLARSDISIIVQGETGTGKSFIANTIHSLSKRGSGPFVTVDIGAIPEGLVESELFGHEKGAFTGADRKKKGLFEIAKGGTLFIDELQNISSHVQGKLLRAVEERKVCPLGNTHPVDIDVRIISATNADIRQAVKDRRFREDLYFRLGEFVVNIPPLRERIEDIPSLARRFAAEAAEEMERHIREITDEAMTLLKEYRWPGNARELKSAVKRAILFSSDGVISSEDLEFLASSASGEDAGTHSLLNLRQLEIEAIKKALEITNGNKTKAAALLQIDYTTLLRKIRQYGI